MNSMWQMLYCPYIPPFGMINLTKTLYDNAALMPIGLPPQYEDVAPETVNLDQVHVDGEIARLMAMEEYDKLQPTTPTSA